MRRVYAAILLLPLFAFVVEAIRLPMVCPQVKRTQCPMMAKMQGQCSRMMACHSAGHDKQKPNGEQKGKSGCAACMDCPLCCLMTFKPSFRWDFTRQATIFDYTVMSDSDLSDYYQRHWKPPNRASLS